MSFELVYFNGKGLAEVTRLMFVATGTAWTDTRFPISKNADGTWLRPEFEAAQASFPMGQVPVLKTGGATLCQSKAIERFVASALKLNGASAVEAAHIDAVGELLTDVRTKINAAKDDAGKDSAIEFLGKALGYISAYIAASGGGGVVSTLSLADIQIFAFATYFNAGELRQRVAAAIAAAPLVAALVAKVGANAGIAAWEAGRGARGEAF